MLVRRARSDDLETIVDFNARLAEESEGLSLDRGRLRDGVGKLLSDESLGLYLIAEADGAPVGQLGLTYEWSDWRNGLFWWVQSVYVVPERRREGILRGLYDRVLDLAPKHGVCGVRLYVDRRNRAAKVAYNRLGLAPTEYEMLETDFVLERVDVGALGSGVIP